MGELADDPLEFVHYALLGAVMSLKAFAALMFGKKVSCANGAKIFACVASTGVCLSCLYCAPLRQATVSASLRLLLGYAGFSCQRVHTAEGV